MRILCSILIALALALAGCTDDSGDNDGTTTGTTTGITTGGTGTGGTGGTGGTPGTGGQNVSVEITWSGVYRVDGEYSTGSISVPANATVVLTFTNEDPSASHDFVVEGIEGAATSTISQCLPTDAECGSETITFNAGPPQETKYFCSIGDHRSNGMEGDFIVE